jgi:excisionase family DNA binding protein
MIFLFVLRAAGGRHQHGCGSPCCGGGTNTCVSFGSGITIGSAAGKECAVAAQPSGKAAPEPPRYLRTTEVAAILQVSPKTVSRWATEGKLPFLKTLGGHRRYPAAEIGQLAEELRVQPTA